jgi:putative addiction module killer protein
VAARTAFCDPHSVSYGWHSASYGLHSDRFEVKRTEAFDAWLKGLKDSKGRTRIQARIDRLANGNPGDVGPIGGGWSEPRVNCGPGYRVYYVRAVRAFVWRRQGQSGRRH